MSIKEDTLVKMEEGLESYRLVGVVRHQQGLIYQDYLKEKKVRKKDLSTKYYRISIIISKLEKSLCDIIQNSIQYIFI